MTATEQGTLFKMIHKVSETDFGRLYRQARLIQEGLKLSFRIYLDTVEVLDDNTFWSMVDELREKLLNTVPKRLKKSIKNADIKRGIELFTWEYAHGSKSDDFDNIPRFAKTYNVKRGVIYRPLYDVIKGYGDDGYGDLLDSFPLWGRKRYEMALEGKIKGKVDAQYQGENYISSRLEDSAYEKFAVLARYKADDVESEETGKDAYYVHQNEIYGQMGLRNDAKV